MTTRPPKIEALFDFLRRNHHFNEKIQEGFLKAILASGDTVEERARLLLYRMVNTQSQPKLDLVADFFQSLANNSNSLANLRAFSDFLSSHSKNHDCIFEALKAKRGWGPKTAALFVRNLAMIEKNPALKKRFWNDLEVLKSEQINLPVDAVILSIFSRLTEKDLGLTKSLPNNFKSINNYLIKNLNYSSEDILIWDDLWFWGFITQNSKSDTPRDSNSAMQERTHAWNAAKYWSIFYAPQDKASVDEIKTQAKEFLKIVSRKRM